MKFKWRHFSQYRGELCGLAIISIIIFHYFSGAQKLTGILKTAGSLYEKMIGSVGVDLFLFLSGIGIAYSLSRSCELLPFYRKRTERVVIPYLFMGGYYWAIRHFAVKPAGIRRFLYDYSLLSFWTGGRRVYWYIALICILYLVSPFVFKKGKKGIAAAWLCSFLLCFAVYAYANDLFENIEIAIQRIPVYFMGMYCGLLAKEDKDIPLPFIGLCAVSVFLRFFLKYYDVPFFRMCDAGYILLLGMLYILLREKICTGKKPVRILTEAGKYSLELYILHIAARSLLTLMKIDLSSPIGYGFMILAVIPLAVMFSHVNEYFPLFSKTPDQA